MPNGTNSFRKGVGAHIVVTKKATMQKYGYVLRIGGYSPPPFTEMFAISALPRLRTFFCHLSLELACVHIISCMIIIRVITRL